MNAVLRTYGGSKLGYSHEHNGSLMAAIDYSKWDKLNVNSDDSSGDENEKGDTSISCSLSTVASNVNDENTALMNIVNNDRVKSLPQARREMWQVSQHKLRLWVEDQTGEYTRPKAVLIVSLYPEGKILHYFIITEQRSAPLDVLLQKLLRVMRDPPFGVQRRPTHISFHSDTGETAKLSPFLRKLGIVRESLSLAPGTMDYAREVASTLRGGPEPPITGPIFFSSGIPMWQWLALLNSSSVLVGGGTKKKDKKHVPPWLGMPTHLKARHLVVNIRIDRVGSQIGIRDNFPLHAGDTIWLSLLHEDGGVLGLALFPSKLDCEARMKDPSDTLDDIFRETTECSYEAYKRKTKATQEKRTNESRKLKHLKPRQFDVRDGLELAYSSTEALRAHWHVVKSFSRSLDERNEGILNNRKWWHPHGEAILMWRGINTLSFDEIDFLDSLGMDGFATATNPTVLQRLGVDDKNIIPVPMALKEGSFGACSLEQISWLTVGCCAASCLVNFFKDIRNVGDAVDAAKVKSMKHEIPYRYGHIDHRIEQEEGQNKNETISSSFVNITVTYDPVLLKNEVSACS